MKLIPAPPFKPPLLAKVYDRSKTLTRRIVKPQDAVDATDEGEIIHLHGNRCGGFCDFACSELREPYGVAGDRWYFREGLKRGRIGHIDDCVTFALDGVHIWKPEEPLRWRWKRDWLPSIHMPALMARAFAIVEEVRVERVQEISEKDAIAEGVNPCTAPIGESARSGFSALWDSIHGTGAWDRNDYVWVYRWRLCERAEANA